jgi:hypothetical protein
MGRILTTRRGEWLPGVASLSAAVVIGALVGGGLGGSWLLAAGVVALVVAALALYRRYRSPQAEPAALRARGRLRVLRAGKPAHYDLASDDSTKHQRYLM